MIAISPWMLLRGGYFIAVIGFTGSPLILTSKWQSENQSRAQCYAHLARLILVLTASPALHDIRDMCAYNVVRLLPWSTITHLP